MRESQVTDEGSLSQHEHEQWSEVMLTRPPTSRQPSYSAYLNSSTGTSISSDNNTFVIHVKAEEYNTGVRSGDFTSSNSSNNSAISNTTAISYEQLSREFYQSYDPSTGLHTGAVLGGILVWLVLYLIYRTKVRKCVIHLIKKMCRHEAEELDADCSDSEKGSSAVANTSMIRTLINPSIVIESSPPLSPITLDQYSKPGEQECLSPFSLHGAGIHEGGVIFQFPYPSQNGTQQHMHHYRQQSLPDQHEELLQLPRSEMDIPSATAKWVQNTPLAARSQQDFAGLMMSMQSHGLLAMHKHCSCPLVWPRSPQPLPLLEVPNSWNKSLPVLSNSLSSQMLSAYETVQEKDIKDIINADRKMNKDTNGNRRRDDGEYASLIEENSENIYSNRRHSHAGLSCRRNQNIRMNKNMKTLPNLTIRIPNTKENVPAASSSAFTRSPVPIPFTPTIMIQNSKPTHRRQRNYDCTTSVSSGSSTDLLLAPSQAPPIHITKPASSHILSPHLLSPIYQNRNRAESPNVFSWSREDIKRYHEDKDRPGSASPFLCTASPHQCSFKYHKKENNPHNKDPCSHNSNGNSHRPSRLVDRSLSDTTRHMGLTYHHRSLSDYNCHADIFFNPSSPFGQTQHRSLTTEFPIAVNIQQDKTTATCSNESNINTLDNFPYTQSQYLLQVPDGGNLLRPGTPDAGGGVKYPVATGNNGNPPSMRHCVHSDSNIAYYSGQCFPSVPNIDTVRRHSAFAPLSGDINLLFCVDNTVRASSSFGSSGSYNSPHHHPHLPHRHNSLYGPSLHQHSEHHRHHSTGMLGLDDSVSQHKITSLTQPHSNLNRSFSAVVMETKL